MKTKNRPVFDKKDFQKWLVDHETTMRQFSKKVGVSHTYVNEIANGHKYVTESVIQLFKKGGYEIIK